MHKSPTPVKRLRDSHAQATRQALISAACHRFVNPGYAATSLDDIAQEAGTTKGAIYHHFTDKKALFRAVYEQLSRELIAQVAHSEDTTSAQVQGALQAFVHHAAQPAFQRVLFKDGPSVLGSTVCREIDLTYSLGLISQLIKAHAPASLVEAVGNDILARMLLSMLVEAAQILAASDDLADSARRVQWILNKVVLSLVGDDVGASPSGLPA